MSKENIPYKIYLHESELPTHYYNVRADMAEKPAPLLHPGTGKPLGFEEMQPIFCDELIRQELDDTTRDIPIPRPVWDFYKMYRPSPLVRAYCLEEKLQTPARIYYKFEGNNTSGSHKLNSAIAQAYYAREQGLKGLTTETGAGQRAQSGASAPEHHRPGNQSRIGQVRCEAGYYHRFRRRRLQLRGADFALRGRNA